MSDNTTREDNLCKILDCVSESVAASNARSLWEKIREEMQSGGADAVLQYLEDELTRCKNDFEREMATLKESCSRRRLNE